jgi:hypothetical protein
MSSNKEKTSFYKNGDGAGPEAYYDDGLYFMKFRPLTSSRSLRAHSTIGTWHERLSHINVKYIRDTIEKNAATGIKLHELTGDCTCHDCHLGKETRKPFPQAKQSMNCKVGEFIHADLAGKMPVASIGGASYFLLLKDECTGFRTVYFLRSKKHLVERIMEYGMT